MATRTLEEKMELFNAKCDYILHNPFGLNFQEIDLSEFIKQVFTRNGAEDPFEEEMSDEYLSWRQKKRDWTTRKAEWERHHGKDEPFVEKINYDDARFFRYNPIAMEIKPEKRKDGSAKCKPYLLLKDDEETLDELATKDFVIMSPVTYVGDQRTSSNGRYLYAFCIDLDGVGRNQLRDTLYQMVESRNKDGSVDSYNPPANIIVNSGNGLHLYYLFATPIALFADNQKILNEAKHRFTNAVWNEFSSTIKERQYQGIFQGFRIPGTKTKFGATIRAFVNTDVEPYSLQEFNRLTKLWKPAELKKLMKNKYNPNRVTRKEAERQWPEWYAWKVLRGNHQRSKWHIKRDLYDWWLRKLRDLNEPIVQGHRYFCIMVLAVYAVKCDISEEELERDALSLVGRMEKATNDESNHFTEFDVRCALKAFKERYSTFPKKSIELVTGLRLPVGNRRNGRRMNEHLRIARTIQNVTDPNCEWRQNNGRHIATSRNSKECYDIAWWRYRNQQSTNKSKCAKETELTRPTVNKWWGCFQHILDVTDGLAPQDHVTLLGGEITEKRFREIYEAYAVDFVPQVSDYQLKKLAEREAKKKQNTTDVMLEKSIPSQESSEKSYKYLLKAEVNGVQTYVINPSLKLTPEQRKEAMDELFEAQGWIDEI